MNAVYLATDPASFDEFGDMSQFEFVRETWASVVAPREWMFILALIAGEAAAGSLVLLSGRAQRVGLLGLVGFHVGLLFFGSWLWLYAVPLLVALVLLLRAQPATARARTSALTRGPGPVPSQPTDRVSGVSR